MASSLSDALDRLYAAPLDGFVALRKELAGALRAAGDVAGSREVAAAKKPSRIAWAINQVARQDPERLEGVFASHAAAVKAQAHGDAEAVRESTRAFREALAEVVRECTRLASGAGVALSAEQARGLGETVRAAITGGTQAQILSGRLTEDAEVEDPFAGLEASPGRRPVAASPARAPARPSAGAPAPTAREAQLAREAREAQRARESREAHERALTEAKGRLDALEQEAREARGVAHRAEVAARRAEAEAERARRAVAALEAPLEKARLALAALKDKR